MNKNIRDKMLRLIQRALSPLVYRRGLRGYLKQCEARKLHLGAGPNVLDGWFNTDACPIDKRVFYIDASRSLPVDDQTFDYLFSEHLIEHLTYMDALSMLKECHRIVRPGGRIRIATPDIDKIIQLRVTEKSDLQQRYVKWHIDTFFPEVGVYDDIYVINNAFSGFGHKFLYDENTLRTFMTKAGFVEIVRCGPGQSDDVHLRGIDFRAGNEMTGFSNLILEGKRY
jgi:predicted SAM-dependent methyltransferase